MVQSMGLQRVGYDWVTEQQEQHRSVLSTSCSVVSNYLHPHGLQPTRLLCPWDFPGKDTGAGCHFVSTNY